MSKVTLITYENFKQFIGKKVEVEITCYAGGIMYPDNNILLGMNEGTFYFISEPDTEDEVFWHWAIETEGDPKMMSHIQVWDGDEYNAYYAESSAPKIDADLIQESFGYTSLEKHYRSVIDENDMASLKYDADSLAKIRELKTKYFTANEFVVSAYLRDIENDINRKLNG